MDRIKLLIIIVDRNIVNKIAETATKNGANFSHIFYGSGTAKNDLLHFLGIGETEKGVVVASVKEKDLEKIYSELKFTYYFEKPGSGISFTIPISSVGGPATLKVFQGDKI